MMPTVCQSTLKVYGPAHRVERARKPGRRFFIRVLEQLTIHLPPRRPVVVLTGRQFSTKHGDCGLIDFRFRIRVSRELNESQAVDVLLHEWAHALSWDTCGDMSVQGRRLSKYEFDRLTHGPKWGLAYSKVYHCFVGTIMPHLECEDLNAEVLNRMGGRR
jgi:hypothetical protein